LNNNKKKQIIKAIKSNLGGYLFLAPWLIGFLVFTGIPFLYTFYLSFTNVNQTALGWQIKWNNFENYNDIFFKNTQFLPSLLEFIIMQVLYVPVILVISFILAVLLNQDIKGRAILRTIFFLPVIILSGSVMQQFISSGAANFASINSIFIFHIVSNYSRFFAQIIEVLFVNFTIVLWFTGIPIILFINALQKIDHQLYEATQIDGASWWQILWKITIPMVKSTALVVTIYTIVNLGLYNIRPRQSNITAIYDLIKNALGVTSNGLGYASAYAVLYTIVVFILVGFALLVLRNRDKVKVVESLQERQQKKLAWIQKRNKKKLMKGVNKND